MPARETIADYCHRYGRGSLPAGQVMAYRIEDAAAGAFPLRRRDFYKIKLLCEAEGTLRYGDRQVRVQQPALIFANPLLPYAWEREAGRETGYACVFTEAFISPQLKIASVADSPLFQLGGTPVVFPPPAVVVRLTNLFEQLLAEMQSSYVHRQDAARNYVQLILHESLKLVSTTPGAQPGTSAARLSTRFLNLLDRQFPLLSPHHTLALKNANEFAGQLDVHPNHLNKVLKNTTGKTTTAHIAEKLVNEAQTLLRHSDWSLAEIGYCLGFGYVSNFNSFFKKYAGCPPHQYRRQPQLVS